MINSLFLSTIESDCDKTLVSFGPIDFLKSKFNRVAFFTPILEEGKEALINKAIEEYDLSIDLDETYAFTRKNANELLASGQTDKFIEVVISNFKALEEKNDFIICESTNYSGVTAPFELSLNAEIARNLATPVIIIQNGKNRSDSEIESAISLGQDFFKNAGAKVLGNIVYNANSSSFSKCDTAIFSGIINKEMKSLTDATNFFNNSIDLNKLSNLINATTPSGETFKMFEHNLSVKAKKERQHIVLPEGMDDRVLQAASILVDRDLVDVTVLGNLDEIKASEKSLNIDLSKVNLIDPKTSSKLEEYSQTLYELRKHKGLNIEDARKLMSTVTYYGTMMLHLDEVDGMVSGAFHTTGDTIKPALQIIKTAPGCSVVSSVFFMCLKGRLSIFGDCAINPAPNAQQLAEIAISSADTAKAFGVEPRVALLSYSSGNSGKGPDVDKVREAAKIAKENRTDLKFEGPIQYDAAIVEAVAKKKMPESEVAGKATVMVFPDLNTGNNTYKAVQREAGAEAIGPMLQGLNKALNDLSRGCSVIDVVNTTLLTAVQAQGMKKAKK